MHGVFFINKPQGISSFGVLKKMRKHLSECYAVSYKTIKIGHAGTLDPEASGLLLVCVGQATKISSYLMRDKKTYSLDVVLGQQTTTDDDEGEIIFSSDQNIKLEVVKEICEKFKGAFAQVPPDFSAIKHKGKKLYEYAREGVAVERKARTVHIYDLKIIDYTYPILKIEVHCSKGTYMRALARDIGEALKVGAHAKNIHRFQSGEFKLEQAVSLEIFLNFSKQQISQNMLPMEQMMQAMPSLENFTEGEKNNLLQGQFLASPIQEGEYALYDEQGKLFALGEANGERIKIKRALV
ncbi:MAG TPA: tRNA pseudouridine(55) synthase TruB [Oligoflexia bacterium]|nr:tRNA pseudouridine(55) synthase TruB [Oligoflexia bacterium]